MPSDDRSVYWEGQISEINNNRGYAQHGRTLQMKEKSTYEDAGWSFKDNNNEVFGLFMNIKMMDILS